MTLNGTSIAFVRQASPRRPPWAIWPSRNAGTTQVAAGFKIAGFVSLDDEGLFARLLRGGSVRGHRRLTGGADG